MQDSLLLLLLVVFGDPHFFVVLPSVRPQEPRFDSELAGYGAVT